VNAAHPGHQDCEGEVSTKTSWFLFGLACLFLLAGCRPRAAAAVPTLQPVLTLAPTATPLPTPKPSPSPSPTPSAPLVALDPGHGGEDLGARHFKLDGNMDLYESEINLQLALRTGEKLKAKGFRVMYTRDGDYYPNRDKVDLNGDGEFNDRDDLLYRNHLVNQAGADLLLSLHENAWEDWNEALVRVTGGTTTYYCPDRPFAERSLLFATLVQEQVLATLRRFGHEPVDRGVVVDHELADGTSDGVHLIVLGPEDKVIKEATQMPGALSEPMFITCDAEAALMARDDVQDALAEAYANAVEAYFAAQGRP